MLSVRLGQELEQRLEALAKATGRSKTYYVREALIAKLEDMEDVYMAEMVLERATQIVVATADPELPGQPKRVPNEIIVRVKPGTDIVALAKSLGAKVVGSIPEMNAYRLQFEDEETTEAGRKKLQANPEVASVQSA